MSAEALLGELLRLNLVAGAAIALILSLRPLVLRNLGASVAYRFWMAIPIVVAVSLLPARERIVTAEPSVVPAALRELATTDSVAATAAPSDLDITTPRIALPNAAELLLGAWLAVAIALLARSIVNTRRVANNPMTGPALIGVLRPQLLLPEDFATRFDAQERELILAHEDVHRLSHHTLLNALLELARCICWFNPLVHIAANRIRFDQELACDAAVMATYPDARRAYAQALLKCQAGSAFVPLGCNWTSRSARRLHVRISLLTRPALSRRAALAGSFAIAFLGLSLGYAAWAQQPERIITQAGTTTAVWTPSAEAPPDTLSNLLEGQRHDLFIDLARQGDIDLVVFGGRDPGRFLSPAGSGAVWNSAMADIRAVNFGAEGTSPRSLLWRLRNGELDGYRAKMIMVYTGFCDNPRALPFGSDVTADAVTGDCAPLFAEISARQPQAKIRVLPPPRNAEISEVTWFIAPMSLLDDDVVFHADPAERYFLNNDARNDTLCARYGSSCVGLKVQPAEYTAFAEELQPWLDRVFGTRPATH